MRRRTAVSPVDRGRTDAAILASLPPDNYVYWRLNVLEPLKGELNTLVTAGTLKPTVPDYSAAWMEISRGFQELAK